jgi:hypothetical protein
MLRGLLASGPTELVVAISSALGCASLLIAAIVGSVTPWWALVAVPTGTFNAIEIIGYFKSRRASEQASKKRA